MKRTPARLALASAITAALALGTVSAAQAAPKVTTTKVAKKAPVKPKFVKPSKAARALSSAKALAVSDVRRKSAFLTKTDAYVAKSGLGAVYTPVVRANIAADKATLAALGERATAAATTAEVHAVRLTLNTYRPEVYNQVVSVLQADNRLDAKVTGLNKAIATVTADADAKALAGGDVTKVRASLAAASAAVASVDVAIDKSVASALAVHANTPKRGVDSALALSKSAAKVAATGFVTAQRNLSIAKIALAVVEVPPAK